MTGRYVDLNGVRSWYETWGSGPPLVLMHGGFGSNADIEGLAAAFAEHFTVYGLERRGHGHTADAGAISYQLMADDVIVFLEQVVGGPAHLSGWSDGGILCLFVAMQRPDLVSKIAPISANFHFNGMAPEMFEGIKMMPADAPPFETFRATYADISPDGADHWPEIFGKVKTMILTEPTLVAKDLAVITSPTLIVTGDDDIVTLEHTVEMLRSIPNAELAVVPGTSHLLIFEKPELVTRLIVDFFRNEPSPTHMPLRRALPH